MSKKVRGTEKRIKKTQTDRIRKTKKVKLATARVKKALKEKVVNKKVNTDTDLLEREADTE